MQTPARNVEYAVLKAPPVTVYRPPMETRPAPQGRVDSRLRQPVPYCAAERLNITPVHHFLYVLALRFFLRRRRCRHGSIVEGNHNGYLRYLAQPMSCAKISS